MELKEVVRDVIKKPQTIAIIADADIGKSMLGYNLMNIISSVFDFDLYTFGLRVDIPGETKISSVDELEAARNKFIFADEFDNLFDLTDRHNKKGVERSLRLLYHNNNTLILSGLPRNYPKFLSACVNKFIFLSCSHSDFINGSVAKRVLKNYHGYENGSTKLNLKKGEGIYFDDKHYKKFEFPYLKAYDTKLSNKPIFSIKKSVEENVEEKMPEFRGGSHGN